jgi:hypothetical protein
VAYLLGHRDVDKAMTDARVIHFLRAYFAEVVGTVPPVPGVDLEQYQNRLIQRFSNVHIRDQLARLAEDGSMKVHPLPSLLGLQLLRVFYTRHSRDISSPTKRAEAETLPWFSSVVTNHNSF